MYILSFTSKKHCFSGKIRVKGKKKKKEKKKPGFPKFKWKKRNLQKLKRKKLNLGNNKTEIGKKYKKIFIGPYSGL